IPRHIFSGAVEHAIAHIEEAVIHDMALEKQRWYAVKIFERDQMIADELKITDEVLSHVEDDIKAAEAELDDDAEIIITNERYVYITEILKSSYKKKQTSGLSVSDKIDRIVTNRFLALPIFALVMMGVYYISITTIGTLFTDFVNDCIFGEGFDLFGHHIQSIPGFAEGLLEKIGVATWLQSLIVDGIIGGVGAVLGFLPQMMVLFILLGFLEGSGYMARIAFMLDKIFRRFGLSGKSFIPMLVATGCGVPGIMASRTIENERDRKMTIITTTFMPCGAKLPIIALISATLFNNAWWITTLSYFIGIVAIVLSGLILKRTKLFAGDVSPFVMELPDYHFPKVRNVLYSMWERAWSFAKNAGTIILLSSVIIWALSHFSFGESGFVFSLDLELEDSILGLIGKMFAWIFAPLGFNSIKATIATIMGLVAKEEVVAVFGVLDFEIMSQLAAFSFLVFNLLCAPCFAAIGAIKREMNDKKWTIFAVAYQTIFAYCASLLIYQIGRLV
ncbi:MAG: ferrous iron transport protein B, partial [Treponema sp.]|nr:ferrous iron transport protein B [Treponema sp.]